MSRLIKIFARREPTVDAVAIERGVKGKRDVVFYRDADATNRIARWSWYLSPPRHGRRTVTLNCWLWAVEWLPDAIPAA
ncbi:hypothetical protein [Paraburkholderia youngii]|uniref:hypothetical protein n=1 Tax=Paraburkholderia youngii TaxID=2782701 RepID=UPI003D2459A4